MCRRTLRAVPSSIWPCSSTVSPMAATGWCRGGTAAVNSGTALAMPGCTAIPVSRPVTRSTGPRVSTGSGVRAGRCAWISTTDALYATLGRKWLSVAVHSLDISSVFRCCGVSLMSSTCSARPDSASARSAGGRLGATTGEGFSAVRMASRVSTGISCSNCMA